MLERWQYDKISLIIIEFQAVASIFQFLLVEGLFKLFYFRMLFIDALIINIF